MEFCTCSKAGSTTVATDPIRTRPDNFELRSIDLEPAVAETPLPALRTWLTPLRFFIYEITSMSPNWMSMTGL